MTQLPGSPSPIAMGSAPGSAGQGVPLGWTWPPLPGAGYVWVLPVYALPIATGMLTPAVGAVTGGTATSAVTDGIRGLMQAGLTDRDSLLVESVRFFTQASGAWPAQSDTALLKSLVDAALAKAPAATGSPGLTVGGPGASTSVGSGEPVAGGPFGLNPVSVSTGPDVGAGAGTGAVSGTPAGPVQGASGLALNPVASSSPPDSGGGAASRGTPVGFGPGRGSSPPTSASPGGRPVLATALNPAGSSAPPTGTLSAAGSARTAPSAGSGSVASATRESEVRPAGPERTRGVRPRRSTHPESE
jgi:hypothetical protein